MINLSNIVTPSNLITENSANTLNNKNFGTNPTFDSGTANSVVYLNGSKVLTTGSALQFDGANLGLGVTPNTWQIGKAIQVGTSGDASLMGFSNNLYLTANAHYNADSWTYTATAGAALYQVTGGQHTWFSALSGTAGTGISFNFTRSMTLDTSGRFGVGTSSPLGKLHTVESSGVNYFESIGTTSIALQFRSNGINRYRIGIPSNSTALVFYSGDSTETMRLDSSGNLGIGTSSPAGKLDVVGADDTVMYFKNASAQIRLRPYVPSYATSQIAAVNLAGTAYTPLAIGGSYTTLESNGIERVRVDSSGNLGLGVTPSAWLWPNGSAGALQLQSGAALSGYNATTYLSQNWYYNGGEKYIANGFATRYGQDSGAHRWLTAPSGTAGNAITFTQAMTLDASGNLNVDSGRVRAGGGSDQGTQLNMWTTAGGDGNIAAYNILFSTGSNSARTERVRIDNTGNVGIGTTSVLGKISVQTAAGSSFSIRDSSPVTGVTGVLLENWNTPLAVSTVPFAIRASQFQFGTDSAGSFIERARITTTGSLLVGTATPNDNAGAGQLWVNGFIGSAKTTTPAAALTNVLFGGNPGSPTAGRVFFGDNTGWNWDWGYINNAGTYGVRYRFTDTGFAYNTSGTWGTISDARLKENIIDATPKLNDILQLRVRNFNLITEPDKKQIGFVAQEVEEIFPGLVDNTKPDEDGNSTKSVKTTVLIPMLVKAIQEQQAMIAQLQADIASLKGNA